MFRLIEKPPKKTKKTLSCNSSEPWLSVSALRDEKETSDEETEALASR